MTPVESVAVFEEQIEAANTRLLHLNARQGLEHMLAFYTNTDAAGCSPPFSDMLLYEWGTYDWGEGQKFELGISRQFIETSEHGEPEISQLRLVFKLRPSAELLGLGQGNHWCESRSELVEFTAFIQSSASYVALAELQTPSIQLSHTYV